MKKVFLEELPHKEGIGAFKDTQVIDWINSIGYKVKFIYDDIEGEIEIIDYQPKGQKMIIKYLEKKFIINTTTFSKCSLGNLLGKHTNEFKLEIGRNLVDYNIDGSIKRNLTIIDKKYIKDKKGQNLKYYKYKCNICDFDCNENYINGEFKKDHWILEASLLRGIGCSCCHNKIVVEGINDVPTTASWMIKYFQGGYDEAKLYTYGSNKKIIPICPDCGKVKDKPMFISTIYKNYSIGCTCGDGISYPEKFVYSLLEQLIKLNQIKDFQTEIKFDWCEFYNIYKNIDTCGRYDFVIKNIKLIIEVDGNWHRIDNNISGQKKEESKFIDDTKDKLAKENGYNVIRISDENNIKNNILNSELVHFFDLSKINWLQCEKFALSNRTKEACKLKRDNPNMTSKDICEIIKIGRGTIIKYLKKGTKLGWCNYNPKEESFKGSNKSGKMNGKPVEIFKDGKSLGVFESCTELDNQSEKLFGVKLKIKSISSICFGKKKDYKGFFIKHISKEQYQKYKLNKE